MMKKPLTILLALVAFSLSLGTPKAAAQDLPTAVAAATPQNITLSGNTDTDVWSNARLTSGAANAGFTGSFPGTAAWPQGIQSSSGGDAVLNKIANGAGGGPYPGSSSLYSGGFSGDPNTDGGKIAFADSTPISQLETVVFQLEIAGAFGHDYFNDVLPTLTYVTSSGSLTLSPTWSQLLVSADGGEFTPPVGDPDTLYVNLYAYQWDLSGVSEEILSYSVDVNAVQHSQIYGARLDQSDMMTQVVPEPSTYALMFAGAGILFWHLRRSRLSVA